MPEDHASPDPVRARRASSTSRRHGRLRSRTALGTCLVLLAATMSFGFAGPAQAAANSVTITGPTTALSGTTQTYTFTDFRPFTKDSPLLESGLLGPVKLDVVESAEQ